MNTGDLRKLVLLLSKDVQLFKRDSNDRFQLIFYNPTKLCSYELSIHQRVQKNGLQFAQNMKRHNCF